MISLEKVNYNYFDTIPALSNVSLEVAQGERFAVIGANGTGKTTILQMMNGLIHPSSGKIFFRGYEISKQTLKDRGFLRFFRERVGFVFQDSDVQLFCPTVLDDLLYGPLQLDLNEGEALDRASEIMTMLKIEHLRDRPTYMLSGGEKKKVAIGSVLTMNPEVLLLDEPTNGLDPKTQCFLVELMLALNEAGKTLVIATHDLSLVDELQATVGVVSEEHRIEKIGTAAQILKDEELLLRVNLIHEHIHRHGNVAHRHIHSHYLFHRHEG
ncbi:MAG: ABC transporter ATP-binding protein [Deltaproteobacteria bacterium]|nr:ABC transporter ATP-binding protein [Deltaproteobacteria bacterium]MBM4322435.1 ABC transporter ATP-binding protein [Deltaproteobacteria bacterium]